MDDPYSISKGMAQNIPGTWDNSMLHNNSRAFCSIYNFKKKMVNATIYLPTNRIFTTMWAFAKCSAQTQFYLSIPSMALPDPRKPRK